MKTTLILCLATIILISATLIGPKINASTAHYPIGEVAFIEGSAAFHKGNNQRTAKQGDPIYMGSTLETNKSSKLIILFIDDTRITLSENTELTVDEFVFDPYDSEENQAKFSVLAGAFQWVSGMISKREDPDVEIRTTFGSIGIRGTSFWAGEIEDGYGVIVESGLVQFSGEWGSTELPAGASTYLTKAKSVDNSDFWTAKRQHQIKQQMTFKMSKELDKHLSKIVKGNIRKRHDYRGQMFPYKENPFRPKIIEPKDDDEFFSDEFKDYQKEKSK